MRFSNRVDVQIAALYALFGGLWIVLSDRVLAALIGDIPSLTILQTIKGWLYVLTSALLIFALLRHHLNLRDIAENKLRESEERYRQLFENSMDGIMLTAQDGGILAANPAACQMLERTEEEIIQIGRDGVAVMSDPQILAAIEQRARTGSFRGELTLLRKDGSIFPVDMSSKLFTDKAGRDLATMIIRDITVHKRAEAERELHLTRLAALHAIDTTISSSFDLRVTLDVLLRHVTSLLGVDASAVLTFNSHMNCLEFSAVRGFHGNSAARRRLRLGEDYAGRATLERRLVGVSDVSHDEHSTRTALMQEEAFLASYAAPLIAKGQVKGVLQVFHRAPLYPDAEWLEFLETLAGQAAIAIDNAEMFNSLQNANSELVLSYDATIEGWSKALDLRDRETEGHAQRVTEMTLKLAALIGMSGADLINIRRGALLHDIGKMGIPDAILLKSDKLTEEEWEIMRKHPTYANELLSHVAYLRPALEIPYCHHEKWDGSGYPRGIQGEEIPLTARLFAMVDVWDALLSTRPYRRAWSKDKAVDHIRSEAGKQFDPKLVPVFLSQVES